MIKGEGFCEECKGLGGVSRCCRSYVVEVGKSYQCSLCFRFCKLDDCDDCDEIIENDKYEKMG